MNMVDTLKGSYFSEVLPEGTNLEEFGAYMGHEIAMQIRRT